MDQFLIFIQFRILLLESRDRAKSSFVVGEVADGAQYRLEQKKDTPTGEY